MCHVETHGKIEMPVLKRDVVAVILGDVRWVRRNVDRGNRGDRRVAFQVSRRLALPAAKIKYRELEDSVSVFARLLAFLLDSWDRISSSTLISLMR